MTNEQARPRKAPGGRTLAALSVLTALVLAVAGWSWVRPASADAERDAEVAQVAAERGVQVLLSYNHATLEGDHRAAARVMTLRYRAASFDPLWATIAASAPAARAVVRASIARSGIVDAAPGRVRVLVLADRLTSNAELPEPVTYRDHVVVTMVSAHGRWLIDDLGAG